MRNEIRTRAREIVFYFIFSVPTRNVRIAVYLYVTQSRRRPRTRARVSAPARGAHSDRPASDARRTEMHSRERRVGTAKQSRARTVRTHLTLLSYIEYDSNILKTNNTFFFFFYSIAGRFSLFLRAGMPNTEAAV